MLCEVDVCDVEELVFDSGQNSKKLQLPLRVHVIVQLCSENNVLRWLYTPAQLQCHI